MKGELQKLSLMFVLFKKEPTYLSKLQKSLFDITNYPLEVCCAFNSPSRGALLKGVCNHFMSGMWK